MNKLVFLLAGLFLIFSCSRSVIAPIVKPAPIKQCKTPGGTYKVVYHGAIPKDSSILEAMCPTELFIDVEEIKTIKFEENDDFLICGHHIERDSVEKSILFVDSDGTNLSGGLALVINLSPNEKKPLLCFAYMKLTFTRRIGK